MAHLAGPLVLSHWVPTPIEKSSPAGPGGSVGVGQGLNESVGNGVKIEGVEVDDEIATKQYEPEEVALGAGVSVPQSPATASVGQGFEA